MPRSLMICQHNVGRILRVLLKYESLMAEQRKSDQGVQTY